MGLSEDQIRALANNPNSTTEPGTPAPGPRAYTEYPGTHRGTGQNVPGSAAPGLVTPATPAKPAMTGDARHTAAGQVGANPVAPNPRRARTVPGSP